MLAFAIIYLVWGSTFLAIRVGVREVPPFLFASMRFLVAGTVLFSWLRLKGTPSPSRREWISATLSRSASLCSITAFCSGPNNACLRESLP